MTEGYRQKLLNWFCSMLLSLLVSALHACIYWFYKLPERAYHVGEPDVFEVAGTLAETFLIAAIYMAAFMVWHFFDFLEKPRTYRPWLHRLSSYSVFCLTLGITVILFVVLVTGIFEYNSCDELDGAFFHQCYVGPPWWLLIPWVAGFGLALLLCIAKGVVAILSRITKAQ